MQCDGTGARVPEINKAGRGMTRGHRTTISSGSSGLAKAVLLLSMIVLACVAAWRHAGSRHESAELHRAPVVNPAAARVELVTRQVDAGGQASIAAAEPRFRVKDFSLESSFDRLAADADAGDRFASCLLSRGLALCEQQESLRNEEQHWTDVAARSRKDSSEENFAVSRISGNADSVVQAATLCEGLSPGRLEQSSERMLQAARLGDAHAMVRFALYSRVPEGKDAARRKYDEAYRENAIVMLERSASLGNLRAMRSLYEVYLHGVPPNRGESMRVEKDPFSAIAIGMVLMQKLGAEEKEYIGTTMAQVQGRVEVLGSDRYQSLFRKYAAYMDVISMQGFDDSGQGVDLASCQQYR